MYLEISEETKKRIIEYTLIDYDYKGNMIPVENIEDVLKDLLLECDHLNALIEDIIEDRNQNYKKKDIEI